MRRCTRKRRRRRKRKRSEARKEESGMKLKRSAEVVVRQERNEIAHHVPEASLELPMTTLSHPFPHL